MNLYGWSTWSTFGQHFDLVNNLSYGVFMHTNLRSSPRILHLLTRAQLEFFITTKNVAYLHHIVIFNTYHTYITQVI